MLIAAALLLTMLLAMHARPHAFVTLSDRTLAVAVGPLSRLHQALATAVTWTRSTAITTARNAIPGEHIVRGAALVGLSLIGLAAAVGLERAFFLESLKLLGLGIHGGAAAMVGVLGAAVFAELIPWLSPRRDAGGRRLDATAVVGIVGLLTVLVFTTLLAVDRAHALAASRGGEPKIAVMVLLAWLATGMAAATGWSLLSLVELLWALVVLVISFLLVPPLALVWLAAVTGGALSRWIRSATELVTGDALETDPAPQRIAEPGSVHAGGTAGQAAATPLAEGPDAMRAFRVAGSSGGPVAVDSAAAAPAGSDTPSAPATTVNPRVATAGPDCSTTDPVREYSPDRDPARFAGI